MRVITQICTVWKTSAFLRHAISGTLLVGVVGVLVLLFDMAKPSSDFSGDALKSLSHMDVSNGVVPATGEVDLSSDDFVIDIRHAPTKTMVAAEVRLSSMRQ